MFKSHSCHYDQIDQPLSAHTNHCKKNPKPSPQVHLYHFLTIVGVCFRIFYSKNQPDHINYWLSPTPFYAASIENCSTPELCPSCRQHQRVQLLHQESEWDPTCLSIQTLEIKEQFKLKAVNHQLLACPPSYESISVGTKTFCKRRLLPSRRWGNWGREEKPLPRIIQAGPWQPGDPKANQRSSHRMLLPG